MKYMAYPAIFAMALILSACATTQTLPEQQSVLQKQTIHIERTREVAYLCAAGKKRQSLRVMYGLNGNDIVAAQVAFDGKMTPILLRDTKKNSDNIFQNGSVIWIVNAANATNVDKVNGHMLSISGRTTVNDQEVAASEVVARNCQLDRKTTTLLGKNSVNASVEKEQNRAVSVAP